MNSIDYQKLAVNTIRIESEALIYLYESIDDRFDKVIDILLETKGKIVLTGIGKSALIAQKIVATLNSTGTTSIFMHAADAIHGDLGLINPEDTVIAISKSGQTSELTLLLPIIKSFGVKTIAMTANIESYLAKACDAILYTPVLEEADPNKLAPTTSTTVQAAMGDAIATVLLSEKGFKPSDFAKYHPGGSLGKQLYLKVKDVAHLEEPPKIFENDIIKDVLLEISSKKLGATIVLNNDNNMIGIITDGDIRRFYQKQLCSEHTYAKDIMSLDPKTIEIDQLAFNAFQLMKKNNINQLAVINTKGLYIGMIHIHDLLKQGFV